MRDSRRWMVYFVSFAAFLGPFTQTIYTPILPEVTAAFGTSPFLVNLSISIFTFGLALMQIVYGPLVDTKGRRRVLLVGVALYAAASIGCFVSATIGWLLLFRAIQAVGIAAGSVVATTVIADLFEGAERGRAMGTFQMMVSLGPVVGPVVGGFVGARWDFHAVFLVLVVTGLLVLAINGLCLRETKPETAGGERFRVAGFLQVLKSPTGAAIIGLAFIQYYAFYNFLVFLPGLLQQTYGLDAEQKGLVFLPLSLSIVAGTYLGGRVQTHWPGNRVLRVTLGATLLFLVLFTLFAQLALPVLIVLLIGFGLGLGASLPVQTLILTQAYRSNRATAIGVYNFSRYMGMATGPILGTLILHLGGYAFVYGFVAVCFGVSIVFIARRLTAQEPVEA